MTRVASLGSVNVDRVCAADDGELAALEERYEWFPDPGETVVVDALPDDFDVDVERVEHGGKGANQAVAAARAGATTAMFGAVGRDHAEFDVLEQLAATGVTVDPVAVTTPSTGTAYVFVAPDGENRIVVHPGANAAVDHEYVRAHHDDLAGATCLLLQNEVPVAPVVSLLEALAAEPERPTVVFDPAPAEGAEALLACDAVDYVTPNEREYEALAPHLDAFEGVVVRKRGGDDVLVESGAGERLFAVTPPTVDVVDTTGAGDVLNGFLAAGLAAGAPLRTVVEVATVAGSLATREAGARNGVPTLETVQAFRATGGRDHEGSATDSTP